MPSLTRRALLAAALLAVTGAAQAQAWPTKPIKIIVPFGAGGIVDTLARTTGTKVTGYTGQPVIVENRLGAGGNIGGEAVAKADPDGHTLLLTAGKDLAELIAYAKREQGKLFYSSPGVGTSIHLAVESLQQATGTSMQHVAYKGALEAVTAVVTSQANMIFADLPLVLPQIRAGKLRAVAVAGNARIPQLPDTPTIAEGGIKGFGASSWFGLAAPSKTPRATIDLINAAFVRALREPDVQKPFLDLGAKLVGNTPDQFAAFVVQERERYGALTKAAGIKPQ
ncbi:MAG: tripartite tricarboxylate transporter substrate-binding protein [Proteobacteria bacterium]|nr:tripartite tricarboxylate transporter substrate-binding protein [Pseudomonadota bacterium]